MFHSMKTLLSALPECPCSLRFPQIQERLHLPVSSAGGNLGHLLSNRPGFKIL